MLRSRDAAPEAERGLNPTEALAIERALMECRVAPAPTCREAIARATIHARMPRVAEIRGPRSLLAHAALASRADAIALGCAVFVRRDLFGPELALPIDLVAHEVTHVAQWLRDGTLAFGVGYLRAYTRGRARGLGDRRAYLAIPYEVEARRVAARVDPSCARLQPFVPPPRG